MLVLCAALSPLSESLPASLSVGLILSGWLCVFVSLPLHSVSQQVTAINSLGSSVLSLLLLSNLTVKLTPYLAWPLSRAEATQ